MKPYSFFDPGTAATFRAAAACILPADEESGGADSEEVIRTADRMLMVRPPGDRRKLTLFLRLVELGPILRYGRRFTKLSPERRARVLAFFETVRLIGKLRQGFFGLKTFVLMGYYGSESVFRELSYPGPRLDAPYYTLRAKERDPT